MSRQQSVTQIMNEIHGMTKPVSVTAVPKADAVQIAYDAVQAISLRSRATDNPITASKLSSIIQN